MVPQGYIWNVLECVHKIGPWRTPQAYAPGAFVICFCMLAASRAYSTVSLCTSVLCSVKYNVLAYD